MSNTSKKRCWAFILYEDSAPSNWREILQLKGLRCAVSPYHDKDLDPTGEPKKPHYHIIVAFEGPTTFNNVKSITDELNQPIPIPLDHVRGMYRYHIHKDNADKYQYSDNDRTFINHFNIKDFDELTSIEVQQIKKMIFSIIRSQEIYEYSSLLDYFLDNDRDDFFDVASKNTLLFDRYISSRRHSRKEEEMKKEIIKLRKNVDDLSNRLKFETELNDFNDNTL